MAIPLVINGVTFQYPQEFDVHWGPTLTAWSSAVTSGMLQTSGVNKASLITSVTANPATAGFLQMARTDTIAWRNQANNANLLLSVDSSNQLNFNGVPIGATTSLTHNHIFVGTAGNTLGDVAMSGDATIIDTGALTIANSAITNVKVAAAAAIALTKLAALTASIAPVTDGSGFLTSSATTATELGYVHGVTSNIQTQINSFSGMLASYLPLAGGTMSGVINMGSNKITSVTQGTNTGEAVSFPVGTAQIAANAITQSSSSLSSTFGLAEHSAASCSLTTTGGTVLIHYSVTFICSDLFANTPAYRASIFQDSTEIAGGQQEIVLRSATGATTWEIPVAGATIITPSAGSHTYDLSCIQTAAAVTSAATVQSATIIAVELKK